MALVAGQDVEQGDDGVFRIARKVARDRVISTVDPEARHGHKSRNRRFDGYKAHLSVDPDSELIDEVVVTPANTPDRDAVDDLLGGHRRRRGQARGGGRLGLRRRRHPRRPGSRAGFTLTAKCPPARNTGGRFAKDRFTVDLERGTVTCPAGQTAVIVPARDGGGRASLRRLVRHLPAAASCTTSRRGRIITIHPQEAVLQRARASSVTPPGSSATGQTDPPWNARSPTSPAGPGAAAKPAPEGWPASPPT